MRLPEGKSEIIEGKNYTKRSIQLRLIPGLQWENIDNGSYGVYKKKGGESDIIIEAYDWNEENILLSVEKMKMLKEKTMLLSGRYTDLSGNRIFNPLIEGSIGSMLNSGGDKC
jgi:hypothetical protein